MVNFALLVVCFVAGAVLKKWKLLPNNTPQVLNSLIFYLALPALILVQFNGMTLSREAIYPVMGIWLLFIGSALLFGVVGKWVGLSRKGIGVLVLTAGLGNTSFLGYPMVEALYGSHALRTAMLADQLGSFLILSTLGIGVAATYSARSSSIRDCLKRVFSFPPVYALMAAMALSSFPFPPFLTELLTKLGALVTPLALISVGFQLKFGMKYLKQYQRPLIVALSYKLILGPLLLLLLFVNVFGVKGESIQVSLIQTAMAPMITAGVVATEYDLDAELVSLMVGIGIPLSFVTIPVLSYLFRGLA
jgi:predicted permease